VRLVSPAKAAVSEEFFLNENLQTGTAAEEEVQVLDKFVTERALDWFNCVRVVKVGAAANGLSTFGINTATK
jgi:hypothetical protein